MQYASLAKEMDAPAAIEMNCMKIGRYISLFELIDAVLMTCGT